MKHHLFLLFILSTLLTSSSGILRDSIKTCLDVSCDPEEGSSPSHADFNYKFMTSGVPQIFWDYVIEHGVNSSMLSSMCKTQLIMAAEAMAANEEWAYHFIDSSGKTPAGLFRSTLTAIGDYDECLAITHATDSLRIRGKYCMVDMFPIKFSERSDTKIDLSKASVFRGYPFWNALCLPSACSEQEVKATLHSLMKPYSIRVNGDISCDTKEEVSSFHRMLNLTMGQAISAVFVMTVVALVLLCTLHHLWDLFIASKKDDLPAFIRDRIPDIPRSELLRSLSIFESSKRIFYSKPYEYDVVVFDSFKLFVIWTGTLAHLIVNVEAPLSTATMDKHDVLNYIFSSLETQPMINDAGLVVTSFISGAAVFLIGYPMVRAGKFPYAFALVDRYIRFLPAMLSLIALEFLWPLTGSGPFFKRIAKFNLQKCSQNWWLNLLFLNNYFIDGIDICAGHTFYSSVDMQLFIIGIIAMYFFSRSQRAGICFSITMILAGSMRMAHLAIMNETTGTLYTPNPSAQKIEQYFSVVTTSMSTYLPAYFMGILIANRHMNGHQPKALTGWLEHGKVIAGICLCQWTQTSVAVAYNTFKLIPPSMSFLVIILTRSLQMFSVALIFEYAMTFKSGWEQNQQLKHKKEMTDDAKPKEFISFFRSMCRLSFSVYISNYLYIRTEYFTRRFLMPNHMFWMLHRILSSMMMIYVTAFLFQIFFLSPFDSIRSHVMKSLRTNRKADPAKTE